ncbi:sulfite exporter TauE/SafE family protein [Sulfurimonas aquatica]|uniref:Sulfite exporter TauE/SafE family protein n=1 Tax=Sulfurimonas aquatica TaxID=2672570 RepID=A0A975GDP9_9BACT|nr:sulfite exporter TauE/SafE family protein [Sulfurimonas aquatica]QSZ42817.1 sulfite exporter TauE/SafE family protein [Sulfurimonas aquatica]
MENIELAAIISFALLGSIGHCIGMCGGFIVTYTTAKIKPEDSKTAQIFSHFLYNIGRVTSYTLLGILFGYFGSLWDVTPLSRAILFGLTGIMMILMGLSFAGKLKFLNTIEYPITKHNWFKRIFKAQLSSATLKSFFILGMLNGLLPCGLVYTMLVTATTTESALLGGIVMFIFGIFTIPTLFSFAFIVGLFTQNRFRQIMLNLAAITVIFYGGWTLIKAYKQYDKFLHNSNSTMKAMDSKESGCASGKCGS